MLYASDVIALSDLDCILHMPDGTTPSFILEAPNGDQMFNYTIQHIQSSIYRDGGLNRRKGHRNNLVILNFDYSSHTMNLLKLLMANSIEIDFGSFPVKFSNTMFTFDSNSVTKNWFNSMPLSREGETFNQANPIPSGSVTLTFKSQKEMF